MQFEKTEWNEVQRGKKKASYDKEVVYSILDATEICHIAFLYKEKAMVQPINFGRSGDKLYLHGSHNNRMTSAILDSEEVSLNVMLLDAMKLTRSAFHHSVNYRSVNVFGKTRELIQEDEKLHALKSIINHFVPNRWEYCRKPNKNELKATRLVEISIEYASAKIANTPPEDNNEDLELDYWAGTIPVKLQYGPPRVEERIPASMKLPEHIETFVKNKNNG